MAQTEPTLLKQPKAAMPKDSESTGLSGDIAIRVLVDKSGQVRSAEFADGPGAACPTVANRVIIDAREAARTAALKARFKPDPTLAEPASFVLNFPFNIVKTAMDPDAPHMSMKLEEMRGGVVYNSGATPESGVLNGKALSLPAPQYPRAALAVKANGMVKVLVTIDVDGTMLSAEAVSGHPLLRSAARTAACKATFTPTLLSGKPVKVTGFITYNFNL